MKKGRLRKIHIGDELWKYAICGQRGNISIYSPYGKRYGIRLEDLLETIYPGDTEYRIEHIVYEIKPSQIRAYIEKNFAALEKAGD